MERNDDGALDALVTRLLREEYAPPREGAYWTAFERSVRSRIEAARVASAELSGAPRPVPWWSGFAEWRQLGMVAAAAAVMAYALSVVQHREAASAGISVAAARSVLDGSTAGVGPSAPDAAAEELLSAQP
jgi:anti-sigma-K factor RskA